MWGSDGGVSKRMSGFLLSLVSPVLHKMVCGAFKESASRRLTLGETEERAFVTVVGLACGVASMEVRHVMDAVELAKVADRLQMSEVAEELSGTICRELSVEECAEVLGASGACGLAEVEARCRRLALERFEEVAKTASFMELGEEVVGGLVDEDELVAGSEEAVLEAVVRWMKGGAGGLRGESVLRKVRYPLMGDEYLCGGARRVLEESEVLGELVSEAVEVKRAARERPGKVELGALASRALVARRGRGVAWGRYVGGGERRLDGHRREASALAECMGRVCSGAWDGSIRIWSRSTLAVERVLEAEGGGSVWCLTCWEGHLISGHGDGRLRAWDVASGRCELTLEGHEGAIRAVTVCMGRLVSGSQDGMVKVWRAGEGMLLECERTLRGHTDSVWCLAVWEGKVVSGSQDTTGRVWDVSSGAEEATLEGHTGSVEALAFAGERLVSVCWDGTMGIWAAGTWELLRTVQAYPAASNQYICSMAVSGSKLVTGSSNGGDGKCEVRVWGLESLECEHTLRQPDMVWCLLGMSGEVWGGVDREVVVWGRE